MVAPAERPRVPPALVLLIGVCAVATGALFVRLSDEAPPLVQAAWRLALATLVVLPWVGRAGLRAMAALSRPAVLCLLASGLALALHFLTWISSLSHTNIASSLLLVNTVPLWAALLTPLITHDRVDRRTWRGIGLAFFGAVLIGAGDLDISSDALFGDGLALGGAVLAAVYILLGRRLRPQLPIAAYLAACYGSASIFLLLACALTGQQLLGWSPATYGWLIALALVPQLLGHSAYNWSLRYLRATTVSVTLLGESALGILLAWMFLAETPPPAALLGGMVIVAGILKLPMGAGHGETEDAPGPGLR
ncbi:MAG: DMT family transporter [Planctomycetota bacterium]|jgi:drug/metabolite transporter (DMT)-like permease|nr:DMT family transporter [Planctomycetota bacterium]MDP6957087.1 DMT family transporter [Planctomycetota bacterium]